MLDTATLDMLNSPLGAMSELVERRAEALIEALRSEVPFSQRVREAIGEALRQGDPSADAIAKHLHVSRATLTRRLRAEGTSLSELTDDVRRVLAVEYLRDPALSIEELARRLSFSDARAFRRAFQRWTGKTPAQHREGL